MANITFRNILDEDSIYTQIDEDRLLSLVYEYAKISPDEIYEAILRSKITIRRNGEVLHPNVWSNTYLAENDCVIITPVLSGGDDGGFVQMAIGAVFIAVGLYTGYTPLVTIGVGMALGGVSSLLFTPDLPTLPMGGSKSTQTYNWSGISTIAQYDSPIPIVYGTHAVGGNLISGFTETAGEENYLYMLIALCEGEIEGICRDSDHTKVCTTSNQSKSEYYDPAIKLDGQPLKNFDDVTWWYRTGANTQTTIPNFDGARVLCSDEREITTDGIVYTTTKEVDSVDVQVRAPSIYTVSDAEVVENSLEYKIQWRVSGVGDYTNYTVTTMQPSISVTTGGSSGIKCEVYTTDSTETTIDYGTFNITVIKNDVPDFDCVDDTLEEGVSPITSMSYEVEIQVTQEDSAGNIIDAYTMNWLNRIAYPYGCEGSISYIEQTVEVGHYRVKITHNASNGDAYTVSSATFSTSVETEWLTLTGKSQTGVWRTDELDFNTLSNGLGAYDIKVTRRYAKSDDLETQDNLILQSVLEVVDGKFTYPNTALLGLKIKATGQLSGSPPSVVTTLKGKKVSVPSLAGGTSITNGTMEADANWSNYSSPTTNERSSTQAHGGTYSRKFVTTLGNVGGIKSDTYTTIADQPYTLKAWVYPDDTTFVRIAIRRGDGSDYLQYAKYTELTKDAWNEIIIQYVETHSGSGAYVVFYELTSDAESSNHTWYIDDVTLEEKFDDCFYDDTDTRFEFGDSARTWDEETYTMQHSDNAILCVRDLLTNTRYGIGKYITTSDLYTSGIISAIKTCHEKYDPWAVAEDLLGWWTDYRTNLFGEYVLSNTIHLSVNESSRKMTFSGFWYHRFQLKLRSPTIAGQKYSLKVTFASLSSTVAMNYGGPFTSSETGVTDGETTISAICTTSTNTVSIAFMSSDMSDLSGEITDVSFIEDLELRNHTWDGVIDSEQSALTALVEMCDSFRCWPVWFESKFNFIIDKDDTPIHTISMGNMLENSFSQSFTPLSEIPYKLRGQYADEANDYNMKTLVAKSTSTSITKANERTIGLKGITNRVRAERELKYKLNKATNCSHSVNFKCGIDALHATAGDVVYVQHQVPTWGGGGRVSSYSVASKLLHVETPYTFDVVASTHTIRYQTDANAFVSATVNIASMADVVSNDDTSQKIKVKTWPSSNPCTNAVYNIGRDSVNAKKFRILTALRSAENEVEVSGLEHLSSLYTADTITVVDDNMPGLVDPSTIPDAPKNVSIMPTDFQNGVGFIINAEIPPGNSAVREIVVQMSSANDNQYHTIATIPVGRSTTRFIDNSLRLNQTYYFKLFCRTSTRDGKAVLVTCSLNIGTYKLKAPTGIRIKGADPNSHEFSGKDCTITWDPVGSSYKDALITKGYVVDVYNPTAIEGDLEITNGDMELDSNWNDYVSPTVNEQSTETVHGGTYSRKFSTKLGNVGGIVSRTFKTTTNALYELSIWVYPVDTTFIRVAIRKGDDSGYAYLKKREGLTQNAWNEVKVNYTETAGGIGAYLLLYELTSDAEVGEHTWYIDDITTSTQDPEDTEEVNLLRTAFVRGEEYTYTIENNLEDSGLTIPYSSLIFIIRTQNISNVLSDASSNFLASNTKPPEAVSGLSAKSVMGGVEFSWDSSDELDHKCYYGRIKVSSEDWEDWKSIENNIYTRLLTSTEIIDHSNTATINMDLKDKDWYEQISLTSVSASIASGTIEDEMLTFKATLVGGTGNVAELYDDTLESGGVSF